MQIQKDDIKQKILRVSKKEFIGKGFQKTSMRDIAQQVNISLGNIYNYYKNKDDIFKAVVSPVTNQIDIYFDKVESKELWDISLRTYSKHLEQMNNLAFFIDKNREILSLIIFKSHGSSFTNYVDSLIDRYTYISKIFIEESDNYYPGIKKKLSDFFTHSIASMMASFITEILMHNIPLEKMLDYFEEFMTFNFYGWEGLLEYDFENMKPKPLPFNS